MEYNIGDIVRTKKTQKTFHCIYKKTSPLTLEIHTLLV